MNILDSILGFLEDVLNTIGAAALMALPDSPFAHFSLPPEVKNILGYINWLIPFDWISNTVLVWLSAVLVYYLVQIILRWVKAIQ